MAKKEEKNPIIKYRNTSLNAEAFKGKTENQVKKHITILAICMSI